MVSFDYLKSLRRNDLLRQKCLSNTIKIGVVSSMDAARNKRYINIFVV